MNITVIGGMYTNGIDARLLTSLETIKNTNPNLKILYSQQEIHSKIYIWKKEYKVLSSLIDLEQTLENLLQMLQEILLNLLKNIQNIY